jgi:hypothetical protein
MDRPSRTFVRRIELLGEHTHKSGQQQRGMRPKTTHLTGQNRGYTEPPKSFRFGQKFLTKTELINRLKHYTTETEKYTNNTIRPNPQTGNTAKNQNTHNPPIKQQINTKLHEITYKEDFRSTQKIHRKSAGNRLQTAGDRSSGFAGVDSPKKPPRSCRKPTGNRLCSIGNRTLSFTGVLCSDPPEIAPPCFTGVDPPVIGRESNHRKVTKSAVFPPVAGNRLWLHPPSTNGRSGLRSFSLSGSSGLLRLSPSLRNSPGASLPVLSQYHGLTLSCLVSLHLLDRREQRKNMKEGEGRREKTKEKGKLGRRERKGRRKGARVSLILSVTYSLFG